jgi:glycosyltransferase involved in cell wall biosynthesis
MKLRVLHIGYCVDPTLGGAEKMIYSVVKTMDKRKFEVSVAQLRNCDQSIIDDLKRARIPVFTIRRKKHKLDIPFFWNFIRVIHQVSPEVIHTHNFDANLYGRLFGKLMGVKKIFAHEHGALQERGKYKRFFDRLLSMITCKIIAVSKNVRDIIVNKEKIQKEKVTIIGNGVDLDEFTPQLKGTTSVRESLSLSPSCKVIGMVARLSHHKNHRVLLEAMPYVIDKHPDTYLILVGNGSQRTNLKKLTSALKIEKNVIFLGHRRDIAQILPMFDIFVLSTKVEGFGISLVEALAMEKPCIATNTGGISDIISDGVNGILVPKDNHFSLAKAILKLIDDESFAYRLGQNGRKTAMARFDIKNIVKKIEILYFN